MRNVDSFFVIRKLLYTLFLFHSSFYDHSLYSCWGGIFISSFLASNFFSSFLFFLRREQCEKKEKLLPGNFLKFILWFACTTIKFYLYSLSMSLCVLFIYVSHHTLSTHLIQLLFSAYMWQCLWSFFGGDWSGHRGGKFLWIYLNIFFKKKFWVRKKFLGWKLIFNVSSLFSSL